MLILYPLLFGCTGAPYAEDVESFRGWCDPSPAVWSSDSRPFFLSKNELPDSGCVSEEFEVEEMSDTEGCSGFRIMEPLTPGKFSFDCIDWDFEVVAEESDVDWSQMGEPAVLSENCEVALESAWLPAGAWESGALLELAINAQSWFFTRGSIRVFPSTTSGQADINVKLTDTSGGQVSEHAAVTNLVCEGT